MHIDTSKLKGEYPPEPECQVNSKDCTFTPIHALCHECGRKVCEECAVGIRHQPQMFKYLHRDGASEDRVQLHCPDCANSHTYNVQVLGAGVGGVVLGLLLLAVGGSSAIVLLLGLIALVAGGFLLYKEYDLKRELGVNEIGA